MATVNTFSKRKNKENERQKMFCNLLPQLDSTFLSKWPDVLKNGNITHDSTGSQMIHT